MLLDLTNSQSIPENHLCFITSSAPLLIKLEISLTYTAASKSLERIVAYKTLQDGLCMLTYIFRNLKIVVSDIPVDFHGIFIIKRRISDQHLKNDYTQSPPVN